MDSSLDTRFRCPVCRQALVPGERSWQCVAGHGFDVAREGYVNLLPVQHKHSKAPGDSGESLRARRDFLDAGHYAPLRDAVVALLAPRCAGTLLDLGCGEGWYTAALPAVAREVVGLDIAKPAIQLAARRTRANAGAAPAPIRWIVGSGAALPLADGCIDVVANLFTQLHVAELQRVLHRGGHALVVTPAADHLQELRAGLFDEVRAHEPDKFGGAFEAGFDAVDSQEVRCALDLDNAALRQLLAMTPYVWKARPERRAALETRERLPTRAAFRLLLFRKRD